MRSSRRTPQQRPPLGGTVSRHFHADAHCAKYLDTLSRAADELPLLVAEFGTRNSAGEGSNGFAGADDF
ncbi:hypothetical protein [Streptomyces spectabilis]|uniref:Uncharacterized protein n=1 Tax=Streptomyces spectabilis TaxID=68270 RepID=A0A516RHC0_STRST|nr:hypothetical protein [Streptomyces spectabilis]QDQ15045.1 hypothetical protein FH965_34585 [Streptomyces spectabilis]